MAENHESPGFELVLIVPGSPVPRKPLEVLWIDEPQLVPFIFFLLLIGVPVAAIRPLPLFVFGSFDLDCSLFAASRKLLGLHLLKVDASDLQLQSDRLVLLPLPPLRLESHALYALKLLPDAVRLLPCPRPVEHSDVVEHL